MRHRKVSRRLVTKWEHRVSLMRNQVTDLLRYGRITTTLAKAKELRRVADRMITLAKKGDLASRRRALAVIRDKAVVRKLFSELREKYLDRPGGYTRVVKIGPRRGDAAMMAIVELVEEKLSHKRSRRKLERERAVEKKVQKALRKEEPREAGPSEAEEVKEEAKAEPQAEAQPEVSESQPSEEPQAAAPAESSEPQSSEESSGAASEETKEGS